MTQSRPIDPTLDLVRTIDVAPELVWAAWTQPALLSPWFVPAPYCLAAVEVEKCFGPRLFSSAAAQRHDDDILDEEQPGNGRLATGNCGGAARNHR